MDRVKNRGKEFWREVPNVGMELVNEDGEVIATQALLDRKKKAKEKIQESGKPVYVPGLSKEQAADTSLTHHWVVNHLGEKLWLEKGISPDLLSRHRWIYAEVTCDNICNLIMQGKTGIQIGQMDGYPPTYIIYRWAQEHPEFRLKLDQARKARAEYRADQIMEIAERKFIGKDEAVGLRLKTDLMRWSAEVDSRERFGKQTKVVGDKDAPVVFHVTTGVPDADPAQINLEESVGKVVKEIVAEEAQDEEVEDE